MRDFISYTPLLLLVFVAVIAVLPVHITYSVEKYIGPIVLAGIVVLLLILVVIRIIR